MIAEFEKCTLLGDVEAPPSKSMAHRYLICSGLCSADSIVNKVELSNDIAATINCMQKLGCNIRYEGNSAFVRGINSAKHHTPITLDCGESGSTLRFLIPIALAFNKKVFFKGSKRLMERPLTVYEKLAKENNWDFKFENNLLYVNGQLKGGEYVVDGSLSSQFISGLLFSLPIISNDSILRVLPPFESKPYVMLTIEALKKFGINIEYDNQYTFSIVGGQKYKSNSVTVDGDFSNAAFLDVFNYIGGKVNVSGLNADSLQGDKVYKDYFEKLCKEKASLDISDCPDLGPILIALAALKNGGVLTGTKRLAIKESNRGQAMQEELSKLGAEIIIREDEIEIKKTKLVPSDKILSGHNDHRIVMALSTVISVIGGKIDGIEAVDKSFPSYFEALKKLKAKVVINEVR